MASTAASEWENFAQSIGIDGTDTPEIQRTEMRRAFFAGQFSMFMFQMNELTNVSDAMGERMLAMRAEELKAFFRNLKTQARN